jgi:four helix bundle protein
MEVLQFLAPGQELHLARASTVAAGTSRLATCLCQAAATLAGRTRLATSMWAFGPRGLPSNPWDFYTLLLVFRSQKSEDRSQRSEVRSQKSEDRMGEKIKSIKDLKVYNLAYQLAMEVFEMTKKFPKEETYSLTDQIRRSSRSVTINIREGYAKRKYEQVFIRHLNDSLGSSEETRGWLDFAKDCKYITENEHKKLDDRYDEVSAMLYSLANNWRDFSSI